MPRPRLPTGKTEWKVTLPADLAAEVELLCWDAVREKPIYGGRSRLLVTLLQDWVSSRRDPNYIPSLE